MPLYEIINPSDPYTLEAPDDTIAGVAILLLGRGKYGLERKGGETILPIMLLGLQEEWFEEHGLKSDDLGSYTKENREGIIEVLKSVVIGDFDDRELYFNTLETLPEEKREEWKEDWHDTKRTSMNNIGSRAHEMAEGMQ